MKLMKARRKNKKMLMLSQSKKLKPSFSQDSNYAEDNGDKDVAQQEDKLEDVAQQEDVLEQKNPWHLKKNPGRNCRL